MSLASINTQLGQVTGFSGSLTKNLESLIDSIDSTYTVIETKGGPTPTHKNTENMASAIEGI